MMLTTSLLGMAKPIPSIEEPSVLDESFIELIPITWPAMLINGPPELPELMAASVWITDVSVPSVPALRVRLVAEIIPRVTVFAYSLPIGEPIAKTS